MKKRTNIIIITILALLLIIEVILVKTNCFTYIDNYIYNHVSKLINPINTNIFKFFSFFASDIFVIILSLFLILLSVFSKKKGRGVGFVFILLLTVLFNQGLKLIIARDRPTIKQIVTESNYSFPSGHTMIIVVITALLLFYIWQGKGKKHVKVILTILLSLLALLVMLSRIYLGVHYFSDIIGGITASSLLLSIVYYYYTFKYKVPYFHKNN